MNMKKRIWVTFISTLVICIAIFIKIIGNDTSPRLTHLEVEAFNDSDENSILVVVLHAFTNNEGDMKDVKSVVWENYPNAEIFAPNYNSNMWANTSLTETAAQLNVRIQELVDQKQNNGTPYKEVILIGHSIGALLTRKIYLYSMGSSSDHPLPGMQEKTDWHNKVQRIVLLAGINRGWSTENMDLTTTIKTWIGIKLYSITGLGKMVLQAQRGAPFVTNLKLDWIRLSHTRDIKANVIQLLGKNDTTTPLKEHKELMATPNFIFIPTLTANHSSILDLLPNSTSKDVIRDDPKFHERLARKKAFAAAIKSPVSELKNRYTFNSQNYLNNEAPNRADIKHIIFVIHGIRDDGDWVDQIAEELENKDSTIKTLTSEYGYFPMARFLLFSDREENVKWFVDQYSEAKALYPNVNKISFLGHSNGTYIAASALRQYHSIDFYNVYFAGSVVRSAYEWNDLFQSGRVINFRNDISKDDWVVALFPNLYQIVSNQFKLNNPQFFNLGSGGYIGFVDQSGKENVGIVLGGHSGALEDRNRGSIINFILNDDTTNLPNEVSTSKLGEFDRTKLSLLQFFSKVAWLVWSFIIVLILFGRKLFIKTPYIRNRFTTGYGSAIYGFLVLALLYSV